MKVAFYATQGNISVNNPITLNNAAMFAPNGNVTFTGQANTQTGMIEAQNVTITRDTWGIPHIHGKTDADAVFGLVYAQAEDDFNRVETNFINSQGRLAEAEGEAEIYRDLRMKLFINPDSLKEDYARSPDWLKALMNAWADGLNFYLAKHPGVKPRVISSVPEEKSRRAANLSGLNVH